MATYIHQYLLDTLDEIQRRQRVLVIYGPRRIGKTTLLQHYLQTQQNYLFVSGEDIDVQHYLSSQSIEKLRTFVGNHSLLVIDEAQKINQVGLNLKLLTDHCPDLRIIATGSSAFDLAHHLGEPLTGRKITLQMFPLSQIELSKQETPAQTRARLEQRLIYGSYPEVILEKNPADKRDYLHELTRSYLYKDILELDGLRKSPQINRLLQLLALQVGSEVSLHELGQQVGLNKNTVEKYLDLLEKSFVLIRVNGYSRNLRKEVSKKARYYFYDVGVRNALVNQFNPLSLRTDVGALWENYLVIERLKKQSYFRQITNNYFWRTYQQQEVDWVEDYEGQLIGYEFKWKPQKVKAPSQWSVSYPQAKFSVIHPDNYLDFIT